MKPNNKLKQYTWIVNTLMHKGALSLKEISAKWQLDMIDDGNELSRYQMSRLRAAIVDNLGIRIEYNAREHCYYIDNPDVMSNNSMAHWMISTMSVRGLLADSAAISDHLMLEEIPAGEHLLPTIVQGIKTRTRLLMTYCKFEAEAYEKLVCPYGLRLFHQRWYMLALNDDDEIRIYALDRVKKLNRTKKKFKMPRDFKTKDYFSEYFGVLTNSQVPMAHVVIRAHKWVPNYLRTLPLHPSQREGATTGDYTEFSYDLRPTNEFLAELMKQGPGIEIVKPRYLAEQMYKNLSESLEQYKRNLKLR